MKVNVSDSLVVLDVKNKINRHQGPQHHSDVINLTGEDVCVVQQQKKGFPVIMSTGVGTSGF